MTISTIERDELQRKLGEGALVLVDALAPASFAFSRLPGAINLPPERVDALASRLLPDRAATIVIYCSSETCPSSKDVAERLVELGYTSVRHYAGGKKDWIAAGLPVEGAAAGRRAHSRRDS